MPAKWAPLFAFVLKDTENRELLKEHRQDLKRVTMFGSNVLHFAATNQNLVNFAFIIKHAKHLINQANDDMETPAHWVIKEGSVAMLQLLLENKVNINAKDKNGDTLIHWAAEYDRTDMIMLLLEHKATCDWTSLNANGETPFDVAKNNESKCAILFPSPIQVNNKEKKPKLLKCYRHPSCPP